jgi:hypothetical protein
MAASPLAGYLKKVEVSGGAPGPDVWGPPNWAALRRLGADLPERPSTAQRVATLKRFWGIIEGLPCDECHVHALEWTRRHPPARFLTGGAVFRRYVFDFHNSVNARLDKPVWTPEMYLETYGLSLAE